MTQLEPDQAVTLARENGYMVNMGQFTKRHYKLLDAAIKAGRVARYDGHWPYITHGTVRKCYFIALEPGGLDDVKREISK